MIEGKKQISISCCVCGFGGELICFEDNIDKKMYCPKCGAKLKLQNDDEEEDKIEKEVEEKRVLMSYQ